MSNLSPTPDAVCYTDDCIAENDGLINTTIGGRDIVVAYDLKYESVGAWYTGEISFRIAGNFPDSFVQGLEAFVHFFIDLLIERVIKSVIIQVGFIYIPDMGHGVDG